MIDPQGLLDNAVSDFQQKNSSVGVAAVLWFGGNAYWANLGLNHKNGPAVSEQSVFQLLSVQKVFTGLMFAGQVVENRTQLRCIPALKSFISTGSGAPQWILQVQPWELATHTANFPYNIKGHPAQNLYAGQPPPDDLITWWTNFAPTNNTILGCSWAYSDLGVLSLGYATAAAAGTTYPALLDSFVKQPWGMLNTWVNMADVAPDLRVKGYINGHATKWTLGVMSCTQDLLNFVKYHLKVESTDPNHEDAIDLVLTPIFWRDPTHGMGICWQITKDLANPQYTLYAKDGGGNGFSTWVGLLPALKCGVVFLANSQSKRMSWLSVGKKLFSQLFESVIGEGAETLSEPVASQEQGTPA